MNARHPNNQQASMTALPCAIIRGGTSKGVFIHDEMLPLDPLHRHRVLLDLMGSPDPRQINGLGGADPLTSKVAIVARSQRPGIDVEYESVEVGIAEARVTCGLMCGNLIAGVGHFAIAEGLVKPQSPLTVINIYCRSNGKTITAKVPIVSRGGLRTGTAVMRALQDVSAPVGLFFHNPGGAITGKLLPVDEPVSELILTKSRTVAVSIVDAGTLYAFIRAEAFGLNGAETAEVLDGKAAFRAEIELVREMVADRINRHHPLSAASIPPQLVKIAIIGPPRAQHGEADLVARVVNAARVHKAYAVSGGICLAAAAAIPGTLVNQIKRPANSPFTLRVAHPSGIMSLQMSWSTGATGMHIHGAEIERSARIIMCGTAYVSSPAVSVKPAVESVETDSTLAVACVETDSTLAEVES